MATTPQLTPFQLGLTKVLSDVRTASDFKYYIPAGTEQVEICACGCPRVVTVQDGRGWCRECWGRESQKRDPGLFLKESNVPHIFLQATFDNFEGDIAGIRRVGTGQPTPSIVLTGVTGSGKSRIACQIMREVVSAGRAYGKKFWFLSAYRLVYEMLDTMGKDGGKKLDIVDRYARYDLLVIDDLGFDDESKFATGHFFALIDMRILAGLPTIITTNIPTNEWARDLGARIESRLAGMTVFALPFGDFRKRKACKQK